MKRFWLYSFAISLGLTGAQHAAAQYPAYNYNTGPSSYPVQSQNFPTVPGQQPYYLTASQEDSNPISGQGNLGTVPAPVAQQPVPIAPQYAPIPMAPPANHAPHAAAAVPQPDQGQYAPGAPGCAPCGTAPAGQGYFQGGYGTPYAYSAPSIGWGDPYCAQGNGSCGNAGGRHFGGGHFGARHAAGSFFGLPEAAKPWFFGGGVLIFRRIDDYNRLLSEDDAGMPILYTGDAALSTMGGFELMGGRYFNCGKNAIMASYWGLFPQNEMVSVFDGAAGIRSSIFRPWAGPDPWTGEFQLNGTGTPVGDPTTDEDIYSLYDTASAHRLRRSSEFHNVEINLLGFAVGSASRNFNRSTSGSLFSGARGHHGTGYGQGGYGQCAPTDGCSTCAPDCGNNCEQPTRYATGPCCYVAPPCGSRLNLSWLAGVRYFAFNDNLQYAALGVPGLGAETLTYDVYTRNQLVGFQVGGRTDFCVGSRVNLYTLARAGVYNNHATLESRLGTETSVAYESNMPGMVYDITRTRSQLAFLTELGAGTGVRVSSKWTATAGYRAIIASGVATSVGNVRHQGQTIDRIGVNAQDYLVLHGIDLGAVYNY